MNKRGVSAVIAAVMLIMITVVAAGLIFTFVIPFVNQQTEGATECFDVFGGLEFGSTAYNCYVESSTSGCGDAGGSACYDSTGFSVKVTKDGIAGVRVSLVSEGSSDIFDIKEAESFSDLRMFGDDDTGSAFQYNVLLEFPQSGGMRTYVAKGIYENAQVGAILENGNFCDFSDSVIFNECLGEAAEKVGEVS